MNNVYDELESQTIRNEILERLEKKRQDYGEIGAPYPDTCLIRVT